MKAAVSYILTFALLACIPPNPGNCCQARGADSAHTDTGPVETSGTSCCAIQQEQPVALACCHEGESHPSDAPLPCSCCDDFPDAVPPTVSSSEDLIPDGLFVDQPLLRISIDEVARANCRPETDPPKIALTELYCVRLE